MKTLQMDWRRMMRYIFLFICLPFFSRAQPDYDFRNGYLISGTDLQMGAVYRFDNVRLGVDAFIHITFISPGITVAELDGASGYPEALQPTLDVLPWTTGYLEMRVEFLEAGTNTPMIQTRVPVSCIDVDGISNFDGMGNGVHEFDEIDLGGGYVNYDLLGTELTMSQTGNLFYGLNQAGIDYPGRDTSARQVMFSVVNNNISSGIIRVGVQNQTNNSAYRLRSVYFKEFWYANGLLPESGLHQFGGHAETAGNRLSWEFSPNVRYTQVVLERSTDGRNFNALAHRDINPASIYLKDAYVDKGQFGSRMYYRLQMIYGDGRMEYSRILMLQYQPTGTSDKLMIYPNVVDYSATMNLQSASVQQVEYLVTDMSGKLLRRKSVSLQKGMNTISLYDVSQLPGGMYLVSIVVDHQRVNARFIKK